MLLNSLNPFKIMRFILFLRPFFCLFYWEWLTDTLGKAVTWGFSDPSMMSSVDATIVMLSYTFQIYFDFSGYCDMASGIASMFNIQLPLNFNSPYKSVSIVEFWSRWHISLTSFLREYLYFPLGGSRKGKLRTYLNIFIVFFASGIWHGANWTFIIWGMLHGLMNILNRMFHRTWNKLHVAFQWMLTFVFLNFSWLLFRADSVSQAVSILKNILSMKSTHLSAELAQCFTFLEVRTALELLSLPCRDSLCLVVFLALCLCIVLNLPNCGELKFRPNAARALVTILLLVWSIISLTGVSVFLYFNF